MLINSANLRTLYTGFSAAFQDGFAGVQPLYARVATTVPSATRQNEYGWLGQFPRIREWIGDRVVHGLATHDYAIKNKSWELTIAVKRDDIEDDNVGILTPLFQEMGRATAAFPDELVWPLLKAGFTTPCYDGQYFFDTDHPVLDADGNTVSVSNSGGGSGTPWFLLDVSRPLKPIIFQQRRAFEFRRMDAPTDEVVFDRAEYRYGVDGRCNVGFGFWQLAYGSRQTLDKAAYKAAREALMAMKGDHGRPLGIMPNLLVVPPALEGSALEILNAERDAAGATNVYRGTAELLVVPWLA
ncbi:head protein [Caldovatus sediminis]|uniref:Head protein n=1 Tax=Caldovatus sediminis TaxID=2041189 RepID=A0A8J2ZBA6_9PROT|nr:Mu-like prophage major head subunit gpT family protein [Caldovatus sediminis]GGG30961.1 head protein [Caldovatus sediminis]